MKELKELCELQKEHIKVLEERIEILKHSIEIDKITIKTEIKEEWQKYCNSLIHQLENEQKGKMGAHKGTIDKMIHTLKTVKEYPNLMGSLFHSNLVD